MLIKYSLLCSLFPFLFHSVFRTVSITLTKFTSSTSLSSHSLFSTHLSLMPFLFSFRLPIFVFLLLSYSNVYPCEFLHTIYLSLQCLPSHFDQHHSHFPISFINIFPLILVHSAPLHRAHFVPFISLFSFLLAIFFLFLVQQILSAMSCRWFCTISLPILTCFNSFHLPQLPSFFSHCPSLT